MSGLIISAASAQGKGLRPAPKSVFQGGPCSHRVSGRLRRFSSSPSSSVTSPGCTRGTGLQQRNLTDVPQETETCVTSSDLPRDLATKPPVWEAIVCRSLLLIVVATGLVALAPGAASAATNPVGGALQGLLDFALHLDKHLSALIVQHGNATYAILWAIVFCETGLVLTPFLPGDSLLFAAGTFAAMGSLSFPLLLATFITAASLGDAVNYAAGNYLGSQALKSKLIKQEYIKKTEKFYDKYGGKTVVLARFVPIIRTFAPFVAGVGSMNYSQFGVYNIGGAVLWSVLFTGAGYFFGNLPFVQHNFTLVVLAIVAVSVVPVILEVVAARRESQSQFIVGEGLRPSGGAKRT